VFIRREDAGETVRGELVGRPSSWTAPLVVDPDEGAAASDFKMETVVRL
jgi:hypothetical protein